MAIETIRVQDVEGGKPVMVENIENNYLQKIGLQFSKKLFSQDYAIANQQMAEVEAYNLDFEGASRIAVVVLSQNEFSLETLNIDFFTEANAIVASLRSNIVDGPTEISPVDPNKPFQYVIGKVWAGNICAKGADVYAKILNDVAGTDINVTVEIYALYPVNVDNISTLLPITEGGGES